jgi:hypothetical protein
VLGVRVFKVVYEVDKAVKVRKISFLNQDVSSLSQQDLFFNRLKPSDIAHHDYLLEGNEGRLLRRQVCTHGNRVGILDDIFTWAKNSSSDSPNIYWLFGHAGSGKITIAYTIARRFEFAVTSVEPSIVQDAIVGGEGTPSPMLSNAVQCWLDFEGAPTLHQQDKSTSPS